MKDVNIYQLLRIIEGDIVPIGETNYDDRAFKSLESWNEVLEYVISRMMTVANTPGIELSIQKARTYSRDKLTEICDFLGEYVKQWEDE